MAKLDLCYIRINVNPELNLLQLCARRETGIDTHKHMEFGGGRMMNRGGKGEEDKQEDGDNGLYMTSVPSMFRLKHLKISQTTAFLL